MSDPPRRLLMLLGCLALSCDLGRADVVTRSPDLGPAISVPGPDAADVPDDTTAGDGKDVGAADLLPDGAGDVRGDADRGLALDGRDAPVSDTAASSVDTGCAGDLAGECGSSVVLLTDGFEDGAAGWMSTGIIWAVTSDSSSPEPNSVLAPTGPAASSVYYSYGAYQDMTAEVRVRVTSFGKASSANRAEIYARYQDAGHFYGLGLRADQRLGLRRNAGGLGTAAVTGVAAGEWHVLKIKVSGPADRVVLEGYLDGVLMVTATDTEGSLPSPVGTVGVGIYGETVAVFDDVKVSSP